MSEEQNCGSGSDSLKLSELLDQGWKILEETEASSEPAGSGSVQARVLRGVALLEEASRKVEQLQLFSSNEDLEELSTNDLRYLLLPALLGGLHLRRTRPHDRLEALTAARTCFLDFLRRCHDYKVTHFHMPEATPPESLQVSLLR